MRKNRKSGKASRIKKANGVKFRATLIGVVLAMWFAGTFVRLAQLMFFSDIRVEEFSDRQQT
ncbi:hypothetical protein MNBD_NITROSPINAE04-1422, partial [hydrothermal vent metagenome]